MYILYKTVNLINNKFYIGVHKQKDGYKSYQFDGYLGSGDLLIKAIKKYGKKNFVRQTLHTFNGKTALIRAYKRESSIVTESFIKNSDNYNLRVGGRGGFPSLRLKRWAEKGGKKTLLTKKGIFAASKEQLSLWGSMSWKNRK